MKRLLKWIGALVALLVLAAAILPLVIPVRPLAGLETAAALATPEDRFVTLPLAGTDGMNIRYREAGNETGRAFVLLHGSMFNADTWDEVTAPLGALGKVYAYDQIPYGLSAKPVQGDGAPPYSEAAAVDRLFALMDAWGLERATLVANSYGAVLAVRAAAAQPERIDALVLGDPAVYVNESMPGWLLALPQVQRMGPLLARSLGTSDGFIDMTWAHPEAMPPERRAKTKLMTRMQGWDSGLWAYLSNWKMTDLSTDIAGIAQPTLVLTGALDSVVPVADSEKLHAAIPGSDLVVIPDCGHVPQEECPAAYSEAVSGWLKGL